MDSLGISNENTTNIENILCNSFPFLTERAILLPDEPNTFLSSEVEGSPVEANKPLPGTPNSHSTQLSCPYFQF